ncbi:MAG TPA: efflux RND transporter periplasmic adaptor subunit, partial [Hyphomicrobiaceae bacterium]|nr:efflux RND transporter periplasmic adaptor subunit [Hyphomicrobiaceae bacterium]
GSADAMFRIVARGEVELDAEVPETLVGRIREGQPVSVETSGGGTFTGKVRLVSPEIDRATRLGRVRVFLGDDPQLNVGGFARGLVTVAQSSGLGVPSGAIMYSGTGPVVQVVKDGKVVTRPVVVGLAAGGRTEIKTGLAAGDLVVSRAGTFLREGDAVRPILPAQKVTETTR